MQLAGTLAFLKYEIEIPRKSKCTLHLCKYLILEALLLPFEDVNNRRSSEVSYESRKKLQSLLFLAKVIIHYINVPASSINSLFRCIHGGVKHDNINLLEYRISL